MKSKNFLLIIFVAYFFIIPIFSHAAIIEGYFTGTIYSDESDEGIWSSDLRGTEYSGHFWYDASQAPAADPNYPHATSYRSQTNDWLNLIYYIDGKILDISNMVGDGFNPQETMEAVAITDGDRDSFSLHDEVMEGDFLADHVQISGYLNIRDTDFLSSDSLVQNFSWQNDGGHSARAVLWERGRRDGRLYSALLEMYIWEMSVSVRDRVSVPEPSSLFLFALGLLGLLVTHRKRQYIFS